MIVEIVRQHIPTIAEQVNEPITLDRARIMVSTARDIIVTMDGRQMTETERQNVWTDAFDLAYYIAGEPNHLDAAAVEARAHVLAGVA
jgi:hypothetical protein